MSRHLRVRHLGLEDYRSVWQRMAAFTDARGAGSEDELWLVEHPSVFTLGQAGKREHLLSPGSIPVVPCDRGGQVTYHGPGQLVAYPLLDLHRLGIGVRALVERIEEVLIRTLADFGIEAERKSGAPGVYVAGAKVAALGLRIRRGRSFHGMSLNVDMDLGPFQCINPCGFVGMQVTQMSDCAPEAHKLSMDEVKSVLLRHFCGQLDYAVEWPSARDESASHLSSTNQ